jgi:lysophospholipase L1-like esterase
MPNSSTLPINPAGHAQVRSPRRRWLFRVAALLVGMSPFLVAEGTLWLVGWQPPGAIVDPYVGFTSIRPLFELNDDRSEWQIAGNRKPLFRDDSFLANKPVNGLRVFCVGGSTVQGRPFGIETAFSTWLKINLELIQPAREVEVVNCGGVSYASYRLVPIVEEILQYQPDLIVLYTGHNEFLEDRTYQSVKGTPAWAITLHSLMSQSKTYAWLRSLWVADQPNPSVGDSDVSLRYLLPTEVEARLDYQGGLDLYHRDDEWRKNVTEHFGVNLNRMIALIRDAEVPLVLMNPVSNLRDCAPFKSQFSGSTSAQQRAVIEQALSRLDRTRPPTPAELRQDLEQLKIAVKLDPRYAATQFAIGQTIIQMSEPTDQQLALARASFMRAKEEDVCPLRMLESLHRTLFSIARQRKVPVLNIREYFRQTALGGVVGQKSLVDHVHPSISSHQRIGEQIVAHLAEDPARFASLQLGDFRTQLIADSFQDRRSQAYQRQLESLPNLYFELGKDQLEGLRRWAAGEVRKRRDVQN